jgi:regulator of protease activity HflC (stomatin/prohibitin superfamily)
MEDVMPDREASRRALPGPLVLLGLLILLTVVVWNFAIAVQWAEVGRILASVVGFILFVLGTVGFFIVQPNQAAVLVLFGKYTGTVKKNGWWWVNPFTRVHKVSLRARNFDGDKLKVNDITGNPIEIAAVIVWRVSDTFAASFEVDNYEDYVTVQSDSAVRHLAQSYPYDDSETHQISLRGDTDTVSEALQTQLQERVGRAGVIIDEARLSHLAYAPEIASAMLQRQQAEAIIAARTRIVDGAVSMVEMALEKLNEHDIVQLDEERKAAMVSNLLVVLTGERSVQPMVNAGTIYH